MAGRKSRVDGLAETTAYFEALPAAARDELAVEIGIIGREILAAQKADVARDTGATEAALNLQVLQDRLKAKIGLIKGSSSRGSRNFFVGRLIEEGRRAQTVLVTRHIKKRRINGNGTESARKVTYLGAKSRLRRRGPNKGTPIGSPYKMKVRAMAARPFVAQPLLLDAADQHLSEFWSRALARHGGAA